MQTTEVYFEQLLIGLLVMAVFAAPWVAADPSILNMSTTVANIASGAFVFMISLFLGVVFDRFCDTLTSRLERRNRLRVAIMIRDHAQRSAKVDDPFPEATYLAGMMKADDSGKSWILYYRSRIRLTRSLAVLGPALTLTTMIGLGWCGESTLKEATGLNERWHWLAAVGAVYATWFALGNNPRVGWNRAKLPKTMESEFVDYARKRPREKNFGLVSDLIDESPVLIFPFGLMVAAIYVATLAKESEHLAVAVAGSAISLLSLWAWWKISTTYRRFLAAANTATALAPD